MTADFAPRLARVRTIAPTAAAIGVDGDVLYRNGEFALA
jgi:hypothetical protein